MKTDTENTSVPPAVASLNFALAIAAVFALSGGLSYAIAVSAPARAVFLCPQGQHADQTNFGVAGGNKTAAQAANTVAGTIAPERTPMQGLHHLSTKAIDMKNAKRGAQARPEAVDAAGVDLNEMLVASVSRELEVRIHQDGAVEFLAGATGEGMVQTNAYIPTPHARALARWLLANAGKRGAA